MRHHLVLPITSHDQVAGWVDGDGERIRAFTLGYRLRAGSTWNEAIRYETARGRLLVTRFRQGRLEARTCLRWNDPGDRRPEAERALQRLLARWPQYRCRFVA